MLLVEKNKFLLLGHVSNMQVLKKLKRKLKKILFWHVVDMSNHFFLLVVQCE